tara:strand:+ start:359 stop:1033 length:675 start_codon:yes stop_codon:yes gene_type:complete
MPQLISKKIIIYLFLFFLLGTVNNNSIINLSLPKIDKIEISGLDYEESEKLKKIIKNLNYGNIFFLDKINIIKNIYSLKTIEEFKVFKNYPSTLKIDVKKTQYLAITNKDGFEYYIGSNRKLIEDKSYKINLPFIFGNLDIEEFFELKNNIENSDFDFNEILNLYFYKSNRWDIETTKGYLVKLPIDDVKDSLNLFVQLSKKENFKKKLIVDLRQKNQIILNEK